MFEIKDATYRVTPAVDARQCVLACSMKEFHHSVPLCRIGRSFVSNGKMAMLHEIEILEVRRIAELAAEARKVRDRLFEKVPETSLGEPSPARGPHDPVRDLALHDLLAGKPEVVALREAVAALPPEIRRAAWIVMEVGRGRFAAGEWDQAGVEAGSLRDADMITALLDEPDLHVCLGKGLYMLGASSLDLSP